jgi:hypothetical protein
MVKVDELVGIRGLYVSSQVRRQIRDQFSASPTSTMKR